MHRAFYGTCQKLIAEHIWDGVGLKKTMLLKLLPPVQIYFVKFLLNFTKTLIIKQINEQIKSIHCAFVEF